MIRFNLKKLLAKLEKETGRRILLKEVSERSGCDKNALSRMVNHPEVMPSSAVIDKLIQYFFYELKTHIEHRYSTLKLSKKWIMDSIVKDFVTVYPDKSEFWDLLPKEIQENKDSASIDTIWGIYERLTNPRIETSVEDLKPTTLLDAMEPVQKEEDGQYTVRFTLPEKHYEFLMSKLPDIIEVLFPEPSPSSQSEVKKQPKKSTHKK